MWRSVLLASVGIVLTSSFAECWAEPISGLKTLATSADARILTTTDSDADGPTNFNPPNVGGIGSSAFVGVGGGGPNGGPPTSTEVGTIGEVPGQASNASAAATVNTSGRFFSNSMFNSGRGGGGAPAISLPQYGNADIEADSTVFWKGVFVSSDTVNHRFGFRIENMSLSITDNSGLYDQMNPLIAELGGEIRFGLGDGNLAPSDAIYRFQAELQAAGSWSDFDLTVFNPTGAAEPNFSSFSFGNFHFYFAPNFDAFVNLGIIPAGQPFTLEYHAFTYASSPGTNVDDSIFGDARFGDPFGPDDEPGPNQFRFVLQTEAVPEPSSILTFGVAAGVLIGAALWRRRRTPE